MDTKLQITNYHYDTIKRNELYKFIITEYCNDLYYQNIDFVKQVLKIFFMRSTKEQDSKHNIIYVKYRR